MPRKLSAASLRMALPKFMVMRTRLAETQFGKMCTRVFLILDAPHSTPAVT